jgi:cystathionine beta-lyase/cystathionine gamma-synthase
MDPHGTDLGISTRLVHLGEEQTIHGAVVQPIFQNSTFLFDTVEHLYDAMAKHPASAPHSYSKSSNPSLDLAERKIADLEGADACKLVGCGAAALSMTIIAHTAAGAHVVLPDTAYFPVRHLLADMLARFGVTHTLVDGRKKEDFLDAIRPETTLVYLEAPSSMMLRMQDVEGVTAETRARGIATMFDNTYNTPLHFNPMKHGVDVVVHSVTKYLGGHSDLTAGAICTDAARMDRIVRGEINAFGSAAPFVSWLVTRGLRTLPLRLKRHEATANVVAAWLEARPEVTRVHHLGLPSYPQRALVESLFRGTGGLFSLELEDPSMETAYRFANALQLFGRGVSWGGHESLVVAAPVKTIDGTHSVIRLYCGLEEPEDLIRDLEQAFEAAKAFETTELQ